MNAAGIDVSGRKSMVAVLRPFGEVVKVPFDVSHSVEALTDLARQLKALDGETWVGMEHTGRYYEPVTNPLLIREYGGNSLRRVKTDKADAVKIARYALEDWADLRDYTPMEQSFLGIRKCFDSPARKDGTQKWVDFPHDFWHVDCVRKHSLKAFFERYQKWCKRHGYIFKQSNAEEVYSLAKSAVVLVPASQTTKLLVQEAANRSPVSPVP